MFYEPNTIVHLLSGVPLSDYKNQMNFTDINAQTNYFLSKITQSVPEQGSNRYTYQRKNSSIRVPFNAERLYNVCYAMFQNSNFGNKWFYAFVRDVQYVNNETSVIVLELDEWQTWQFDVNLQTSFVEREHVADDVFGRHLIDEGLACGDYVTNESQYIDLSECWIAVNTTVTFDNNNFTPVSGGWLDGVYSGTKVYTYDWIPSLQSILYALATEAKSDAVVGMYMLPKEVAGEASNGGELYPYGIGYFKKLYTIPSSNSLNGYTPRNKKLLTYPYRCCCVTATTGGASKLRYEYLTTYQLVMRANRSVSGSAILYPQNYKGMIENVGECVQLEPWQQCQWIKDSFMNWSAVQNIRYRYDYTNAEIYGNKSLADSSIGNLASIAKNPMNGWNALVNEGQAIAQTETDIWFNQNMITRNLQEEREVFSLVPPAAKGSMSGSPLISSQKYGFYIENRSISRDYAETIDQFFDMYGYKVSKVKQIDFTSRPFWNYIKTIGCNATGCIPRVSINIIKNMFDNGVTMWHDDDIGNYGRNNSTTSPDQPLQLSIINGQGSGEYYPNDHVVIIANEPPANQRFNGWVHVSGNAYIDNPSEPSTTVTMMTQDSSFRASYSGDPSSDFGLVVINGSGTGTYQVGTRVPIVAENIEGNTFVNWTFNNGNAGTIVDPNARSTEFIMGYDDVVIQANYEQSVDPSVTTMADFIETMEGAVEWDATVGRIQQWYYGSYVKDAWCATTVSYAAYNCGVQGQVGRQENVDVLWQKMNADKWYTANYGGTNRLPKRGDVIFFSRNHTTADLTHVGVVTKVVGTTISYISGNTNKGSGPDGIFTHDRDISDMYIVCMASINY